MKRVISIGVCVLMIVVLFTGCGCEHTYTSKVVKEATYEAEGEMEYTCSDCGKTYKEAIAKLEKHVVPTSVLDETLSNLKYRSSVFSISLAELVDRAMTDYKLTYYSGEQAIESGVVAQSDIDGSVDIDYLYYAVISGETMYDPEMTYMTKYEEKAVVAWMLFDESDQLVNSGINLCNNLQTCAILLMC